MASFVILKFTNDDEAVMFCEANGYYVTSLADTPEESSVMRVYPTIDGRYRAPTKFCPCAEGGRVWSWDTRHGWCIHSGYLHNDTTGCMKPSEAWGSNHRAVIGCAIDHTEKPSRNTKERWVQEEFNPRDLVVNQGLLPE